MSGIRKTRNSSIELLKVIGMIFIIVSSAAPYGATVQNNGRYDSFIDLKIPVCSLGYFVFLICRWAGQIGDILFISCSAWFLSDCKKSNVNKTLKLCIDTWIISVVGLLCASIFMQVKAVDVIKSLFPVTTKRNWFVSCYIVYYLLHPYINKAIESLGKNQLKKVVIVCFFIYSFLATLSKEVFYATDLTSFIMIHILVAYDKKYLYKNKANKREYFLIILGYMTVFIWCVMVTVFGPRVAYIRENGLVLCKYYNPVLIIMGMCSINIFARKTVFIQFINEVSSVSLFVYLIHANYFWLTYGKYCFYDFMLMSGINRVITLLALVFIYFTVSVCVSLLYKKTIGRITALISDKVSVLLKV